MRITLPALTALTLSFQPLAAASLRSQVTLDTPDVHLSDLFEDAGPAANRVLGTAPSPGNRLMVEAPQLVAIARQFGVDWRPASSADRVVLDRPGRLLPREDVLAALRLALPGSGAPADCDVDLPGYAPPLVAAGVLMQVDVEQIDFDPATGRFSALLVINSASGSNIQMAPIRARVAGRALGMVEVAVPTRRVLPGEILGGTDIRLARVRSTSVRAEVAQTVADAVGLQARHPLTAGQPIPLADIARPVLVQKGARVVMTLESSAMALSAVGQALESGPMGAPIHVLNPLSRAVIEAEVTGPDQVRVAVGKSQVAAR